MYIIRTTKPIYLIKTGSYYSKYTNCILAYSVINASQDISAINIKNTNGNLSVFKTEEFFKKMFRVTSYSSSRYCDIVIEYI